MRIVGTHVIFTKIYIVFGCNFLQSGAPTAVYKYFMHCGTVLYLYARDYLLFSIMNNSFYFWSTFVKYVCIKYMFLYLQLLYLLYNSMNNFIYFSNNFVKSAYIYIATIYIYIYVYSRFIVVFLIFSKNCIIVSYS